MAIYVRYVNLAVSNKVKYTLTLSPRFWALNITFLMALTHSSRLGMESADNTIVLEFVLRRKPFSPDASHDMAYRRSIIPWGKYGS